MTWSWPPPVQTPPASAALATNGGEPVDVSRAAPPVAGEVLTATDPEHAVWRVPGLKYDGAIRFNVDALGQATIEPGTWGFVQTVPVASVGVTVSVVSSLASPPIDSRFGLYIAPTVTVPVTVALIGASQIMGLDGALATSIVLLPGAMYEWVFYHEGGVAIWGLVSDTTHVARALRSSAAPNAPVIITGASPNPGDMLIATAPGTAAWQGLVAGAGLTKTANTIDVVAADGSIVVAADNIRVGVLATDAQHGNRGGGALHANVVAAGAAGFMSGADKSKHDNLTDQIEASYTRLCRSRLSASQSQTIQLISGTAYWVYIGRATKDVIIKQVSGFYVLGGTGTTNGQMAAATTPAPPNGAGQTITVVTAFTNIQGTMTNNNQRVWSDIPSQSATIVAGSYVWIGIRIAMGTTQPTMPGLFGADDSGVLLETAGTSPLTNTTYSGVLPSAGARIQGPEIACRLV